MIMSSVCSFIISYSGQIDYVQISNRFFYSNYNKAIFMKRAGIIGTLFYLSAGKIYYQIYQIS